MTHRNYFEIEADSYFELGARKGELFRRYSQRILRWRKRDHNWSDSVRRAQAYLRSANDAFPHLVEELRGYAQSAQVPFDELWALSLEDEVGEFVHEKCTTVITNNGSLIAHNEDWDDDAEEAVCVLKKTIGDLRMLELYYFNTLGGNAISINSHGFVHSINSVSHSDRQVGVPKNIVARWLSETNSPESDYRRLTELKRASGYHHCLTGLDGQIWSIECSATRQVMARPKPPFVHTNHYLSELSALEGNRNDLVPGSRSRYRCASENARESMTMDSITDLASDRSEGRSRSVFNRRTIARMIVDVRRMKANIWLLREQNRGWISYDIQSLFQS